MGQIQKGKVMRITFRSATELLGSCSMEGVSFLVSSKMEKQDRQLTYMKKDLHVKIGMTTKIWWNVRIQQEWVPFTENNKQQPHEQMGRAIFNLSSHSAHRPVTEFGGAPRNTFCLSDKNRESFDSFPPDGCCWSSCCPFFIWPSKGKEVSAPD